MTQESGSVSAEIIALLSQHPFLSDLPLQIRNRLNAYVKTKRYSNGATIFQKVDPGNGLFVVRSGTVKIDVRSTRGKEAVFNLMRAGDFFGEIALLDGLPRTANAMAMIPARKPIRVKYQRPCIEMGNIRSSHIAASTPTRMTTAPSRTVRIASSQVARLRKGANPVLTISECVCINVAFATIVLLNSDV